MRHRSPIQSPNKTQKHRDNRFHRRQAQETVKKQQFLAETWRLFHPHKKEHVLKRKSEPYNVAPTDFSPSVYIHCLKFERISHKLIFLLLLTQFVIPIVAFSPRRPEIHNMPVEDIPSDWKCSEKTKGYIPGKVCSSSEATYYMKEIEMYNIVSDSSLEAYNREFVRENLEITVPVTRFFYEARGSVHYIASKKIEGFIAAKDFRNHPQAEELMLRDIARLIVAMTFIHDLHDDNWGVDKQGIVLIDVDAIDLRPESFRDILFLASNIPAHLKSSLSLTNIIEMQEQYTALLTKPRPKFCTVNQLSDEQYITLLNIYIKVCQDTIIYIQQHYPELGSDTRSLKVGDKLKDVLKYAYECTNSGKPYLPLNSEAQFEIPRINHCR